MNPFESRLRTITLLLIALFGCGCSTSPQAKSEQAVERDASAEAVQEQALAGKDASNIVEVRRTQISYAGKEVVDVRDYTLSRSDLSNGASGTRIEPLFDALVASELGEEQTLVVRVRPEVPHRLLTNVIRTARESGSEHLELRVHSDFVDYISAHLTSAAPSPSETAGVLTVGISAAGFHVRSGEDTMAAIEGCPRNGASVCVDGAEPSSVAKGIENFRMAARKGKQDWLERFEVQLLGVYDFRRLYNVVARWKSKHADGDRVIVSADPDIPVMLLSQTIAVVNSTLPESSYASDEAFVEALETLDEREDRFADVLVGLRAAPSKTPMNAGIGSAFDSDTRPDEGPEDSTSSSGTLVTKQPIVTGSLSKQDIREVIADVRPELRRCYEEELQKAPGLSGRVTVYFTIAGDGSVIAAKIKRSTLDNTSVEACVAARIRRLVFPKPEGGGIVLVNYPFDFTPKN